MINPRYGLTKKGPLFRQLILYEKHILLTKGRREKEKEVRREERERERAPLLPTHLLFRCSPLSHTHRTGVAALLSRAKVAASMVDAAPAGLAAGGAPDGPAGVATVVAGGAGAGAATASCFSMGGGRGG